MSYLNSFNLHTSLSGGELFERITAEGYTMSEAEVINYMRQICEGVKHMHEKNIIHLGKLGCINFKHANLLLIVKKTNVLVQVRDKTFSRYVYNIFALFTNIDID